MDAKVKYGLTFMARGKGLREAVRLSHAPYGTLHRAWKSLGGDTNSDAWQAFVVSLPELPAAPPEALRPEAPSTPLADCLKRSANRHGNAVPYGKKGPWARGECGAKASRR